MNVSRNFCSSRTQMKGAFSALRTMGASGNIVGLVFVLLYCFGMTGSAQTNSAPAITAPSIATQTNVPVVQTSVLEVPLILSVTDHKGKYVDGLMPSDLRILDNNQEQSAITFFEHETDLPLDVAIVVDVSSSIASRFSAEQSTIRSFVQTVMRPSDTVKLFAFNDHVKFAAEVTKNWKDICRRVKKLKPNGDTALYDAIIEAADFLRTDSRSARRMIIVITDGEENKSRHTIENAIAIALRAECAVYSVNVIPQHLVIDDDDKRGQDILKLLADATGGAYLGAGQDGNLSTAFAKIRRELRSQYAIAYRPSNLRQSVFHRIEVIAARRLHVRCRTGYYASDAHATSVDASAGVTAN